MEKHITLKGTNEGYFLILNEESGLNEIRDDLGNLFDFLKKDNKYDQELELTIDSGNRILKQEVKESLSSSIHKSSNFVVKNFTEHVVATELAEQWHRETSPYMCVRNIRNGQMVHSDRDIILIGDIRPGGLVRSAGSVLVIGEVQGTIHAGAKGDEQAIIIAPFTYNGQVRIGGHIEIIETEEDEESERVKETKPQIVFLNDLHVIEFADVGNLAQIRPEFAKDVGGFEEWLKQL